ncbi:hypothetical protein F4824DRAFT_442636, partial [Ustulina deusta]
MSRLWIPSLRANGRTTTLLVYIALRLYLPAGVVEGRFHYNAAFTGLNREGRRQPPSPKFKRLNMVRTGALVISSNIRVTKLLQQYQHSVTQTVQQPLHSEMSSFGLCRQTGSVGKDRGVTWCVPRTASNRYGRPLSSLPLDALSSHICTKVLQEMY